MEKRETQKIGTFVMSLTLALYTVASSGAAFAANTPLVCKTGFKPGKTPQSLVVGAKPKCVEIAQVNAGKKLLTGSSGACALCHSKEGIVPSSTMNSNLRTQGYTLAPAQITAAFTAHLDLMGAVSISGKDAKAISQYLQSIK